LKPALLAGAGTVLLFDRLRRRIVPSVDDGE
jgi:hypothetical protein